MPLKLAKVLEIMFFTAAFTVLVPWIALISSIVLFLYYWIAKVYFKNNNFIIF